MKVDELKDKEAYKKEWNIDGWQASLDRMTPEQREVGSLLISPATKNS